jgi:Tol biopolymer transport system component
LNSIDKSVRTFRSTIGIYEGISASPDGKKLAYIKRPDMTDFLYVSNIDSNSTSDSLIISSGSGVAPLSPSWTHNNELMYLFGGPTIYQLQVYCGKNILNINRQVYAGRFAFSHDGKSMIFSAYDDSLRVSLYCLDISSGVTRLLVKADSMKSFQKIYNPAISPDDSRIAFSIYNTAGLTSYHPNEIWISNIDGSNLKKVCSDGSMPAWSPDGNKIAYFYVYGPHINLINVDGTNNTQINAGWTNEFVWIY